MRKDLMIYLRFEEQNVKGLAQYRVLEEKYVLEQHNKGRLRNQSETK